MPFTASAGVDRIDDTNSVARVDFFISLPRAGGGAGDVL
jgi:hypothetical protein